jgi:hypothetical protein
MKGKCTAVTTIRETRAFETGSALVRADPDKK